MMLPSGNDAAHQIAQIGGTILKIIRDGDFDKQSIYSCEIFTRMVLQD